MLTPAELGLKWVVCKLPSGLPMDTSSLVLLNPEAGLDPVPPELCAATYLLLR